MHDRLACSADDNQTQVTFWTAFDKYHFSEYFATNLRSTLLPSTQYTENGHQRKQTKYKTKPKKRKIKRKQKTKTNKNKTKQNKSKQKQKRQDKNKIKQSRKTRRTISEFHVSLSCLFLQRVSACSGTQLKKSLLHLCISDMSHSLSLLTT